MLDRKSIRHRAFQIQHAYQAVLPKQGHDQFRAHLHIRFALQVARVQAHVNHTDGPALRRRFR